MDPLLQTLDNSIPVNNERWRGNLHIDETSVYIRQTIRWVEGKYLNTIDLAYINIEEEFQGQGRCTRMIAALYCLAVQRNRALFVECVHNPVLVSFLRRQGFKQVSEDPSFLLQHE